MVSTAIFPPREFQENHRYVVTFKWVNSTLCKIHEFQFQIFVLKIYRALSTAWDMNVHQV